MRRNLLSLWVTSLTVMPVLLSATTLLPGQAAAVTGPGTLTAVAAVSADYVWAVGYEPAGRILQPIIARWNGRAWREVQIAPDTVGDNTLFGVAAISKTSAWAVGDESRYRTLILHWNGRKWRQVASPAHGSLDAVAATSARNAWAVGFAGDRTVIERWNGRSWRQVRSPVRTGHLLGVTATSAANAWAVGSSGDRILLLHWNGKSWRRFPAPSPKHGALNAVTATSARNAWAVGTVAPPTTSLPQRALIEHWNGRSWRLDPVSQPPQCCGELFGVGASSARNAWAVGIGGNGPGFSYIVIERWQGRRWRPVTSPVKKGTLYGVAAIPAGRAWTVGLGNDAEGSLIMTWNGTAWH